MGRGHDFFHPSRAKRRLQQEAENQRNRLAQQAAQARQATEQRKAEALAAIATSCANARTEIATWHQNQTTQANQTHAESQATFDTTLAELSQAYEQVRSDIISSYNAELARIEASLRADEAELERCTAEVLNRASAAVDYYGNHSHVLENMWQQVESEMLDKECIGSYSELKNLDKSDSNNTKHYTLLVAVLKQLQVKNIIGIDELERFGKFLHALYTKTVDFIDNSDFDKIDSEIIQLFEESLANRKQQAYTIYASEQNNIHAKYSESKDFKQALELKASAIRQEINSGHSDKIVALTRERDQKFSDWDARYQSSRQEVEARRLEHQTEFDNYITSLNAQQQTKLDAVITYDTQERANVETHAQTQLAAIDRDLREQLQQISETLQAQMRQVDNIYKATVINGLTLVAASVATYYSFGLGTGVVAEATQSLFGLTSLASAKRLADGSDSIGLSFQANLPYAPTPINYNQNHSATNTPSAAPAFTEIESGLAAVNARFQQFNRELQGWQTEAEHNLFYSLNRGVSPPQLNFSEALAFHSAQGATRSNITGHASLGALGSDGLRRVTWDFALQNQGRFTGSARFLDSEVQSILQRVAGVSNTALGQNWPQAQVIHFTKNKSQAKEIQNKKQTDKNQPQQKQFELLPLLDKQQSPEQQAEQYIKDFIHKAENRSAPPKQESTWDKFKKFYVEVANAADEVNTDYYDVQNTPELQAARAAGARGLKKAAVNTVQIFRENPIHTLQNLAVTTWDGLNEISDITTGIASKDSLQRGRMRGTAVLNKVDEFKNADGLKRNEIATEVVATVLFSYVTGNLTKLGALKIYNVAKPAAINSATSLVSATKKFVANHDFKSPIVIRYDASRLNSGIPLDLIKPQKPIVKKTQGKSPNVDARLTKGQLVEYLQNVNNVPLEQLILDMKRIGNTKTGHGILEQYNPELVQKVGIYKFKYTNLESGVDKMFIEIHKAKGPNDFHHMHITDRFGNVYDKNLNNLTAKFRKENPGLNEKIVEKRVERLPDAHIEIKEFVELNIRPINDYGI